MMELPCKECLKLPVCKPKKTLPCEDLYRFCVYLDPVTDEYVKLNFKSVREMEMMFSKRLEGTMRSEYKIVIGDRWK